MKGDIILIIAISLIISALLYMLFIIITTILHEYIHYYCYKYFSKDKNLENIMLIRTLKSYSAIKINCYLTIFYVGKDEYDNFNIKSFFSKGRYINSDNFKKISEIKIIITAILPRIVQAILYIIIISFVYLVALLFNNENNYALTYSYYSCIIVPLLLVSVEFMLAKSTNKPKTDQEIAKNPVNFLLGNYNNDFTMYKTALVIWIKNNLDMDIN